MTVCNFPKQLIEIIQSKECILFVGSGISRWSGLPSWKELIQKMVEFLDDRNLLATEEKTEIKEIVSRGDLMMAASLCASRMRKSDFREFIDEIFIKPNPKPHKIHRIIVDLGSDCFITANYDRLLQDAYQSVHDGLVLFSVNNDQPIEQARILKHGSFRFIFTPHGCAEKCDTIVLKQEDYRSLRLNSKYTIETLQYLLISRPVVYLGFSLRDPDFLMIKDQIAATYQGAERDHFAIMPDVSDLQKKFWREQYGINIISYETKRETKGGSGCKEHSELLHLLEDLHRIAKERSTILEEPTLSFAVQFRSSLIRYCEALIYTSSVRQQGEFKLTASFRKDISPDTESSLRHVSPFKRRMPVLELLDSFSNLILIGSPGAGKTHAVTAYATILAQRTLSKLRKIPESDVRHSIPLILAMKEYKGDIKEMIVSRLPRNVDADKALESGCLVLIFDAVNEVSRDLFETKVMVNDISWLINKFPRNRFIFTSRSMNYVSAWPLPVFELEPISYGTLEDYLKESCGIALNNIRQEMVEILRTPLFLTLFVASKENYRNKLSNAASLLQYYLSAMEQTTIEKTGVKDLSLEELLAPIAYRMLDHGVQTISPHNILVDIQKSIDSEDSKRVDIFNTLISLGVLVPDAEGKIGFFHQSVFEYLAAIELVSVYSKNPTLLQEKINFLRWDETILLFATLLPSDQKETVLRKIADNDIVFACRIFESATIKEKTTGFQLFDMISERLSNQSLSVAEKEDLAEAIRLIAPYGRKEVLMGLLDDQVMTKAASISLARMGVKEAIPQITKFLLKDNTWPSDFARALGLLADKSIIPKLIEIGRQVKEEGLLTSNLAHVLENFESDALYSEILKLVGSNVVQDRIFAAEILQELDSQKAKEILAKMLLDPEYKVKWRAIFGLRGGFKRARYRPYRTAEIVSQMFTLLADEKLGDNAVGYLRELQDHTIVKEAANRLEGATNEYERINICSVIAKYFPETAKEVLFEALDNYKPAFHESLYFALASLGIEYIFPYIFSYLKTKNSKLRQTIIDALRLALRHDEKLPINIEDCEFLINLWETSDNTIEKFDIGLLLTYNCSHLSKGMLLKRFSDPTYPLREQLIDLIANLDLVKGDLSPNVIEWLTTKLDYKSQLLHKRCPVAIILGKVCNESAVIEKLIPLLQSENKALRSNAYVAISQAERRLGKRFIKK